MQPELIIIVALAQLVVPMFAPAYTQWSLVVAAVTTLIVAVSAYRARAIAHRYPPALPPARVASRPS